LEATFALGRPVGAAACYAGVGGAGAAALEAVGSIRTEPQPRAPSLADVEGADAMLVLGEDVPSTAPRFALAMRQAVRNRQKAIARALDIPAWLDQPVRTAGLDQRSPLYLATAAPTRLDSIAAGLFRAGPAPHA